MIASAVVASRGPATPLPVALFGPDRILAFASVGALTTVNGVAAMVGRYIVSWGPLNTALALGGVSAIIWFAIFSLIAIARQPGEPAVATTKLDAVVLALMLSSCILPYSVAASGGLAFGGVYLAWRSSIGTRSRRVALVMLALTGPLLWGRLILALVAPLVLRVDAQLAALIVDVPVRGNIVDFANGQGSLYVGLGCSSLHNMSLAILLFAVATQILEVPLTRGMILIGALGVAAIGIVNVVRLAAIAQFPDHFEYLHEGTGAMLFGYAGLLATLAVIAPGIYLAKHRH